MATPIYQATKITDLSTLTSASLSCLDILPVVDITAKETKSITVQEINNYLASAMVPVNSLHSYNSDCSTRSILANTATLSLYSCNSNTAACALVANVASSSLLANVASCAINSRTSDCSTTSQFSVTSCCSYGAYCATFAATASYVLGATATGVVLTAQPNGNRYMLVVNDTNPAAPVLTLVTSP